MNVPIWLSIMTLVLSDCTEEAIPKSMSLRRPATRRKLAGLRS